jgi:hypothetical protein
MFQQMSSQSGHVMTEEPRLATVLAKFSTSVAAPPDSLHCAAISGLLRLFVY